MEPTFRCDDPTKQFIVMAKRGAWTVRQSEAKVTLKALSDAKENDVQALLKARFGDNWKEIGILEFYVSALNIDALPIVEHAEECDCMQEESGFGRL